MELVCTLTPLDGSSTNRSIGTGEHGVGEGKRQYLVEELSQGTVDFMKTIKKTLDPLNLFNPGKVSQASKQRRRNYAKLPLIVVSRLVTRVIRIHNIVLGNLNQE
jgi:hypothetical protein